MRFLVLISFLLWGLTSLAQNPFQQAYLNHPTLTPGVLEAVAWSNTRMRQLNNEQPSCSGYPQAYGIMGLHDDGLGYFHENGNTIAAISGISVADQKNSVELEVEAYATTLEHFLSTYPDPYDPQVIKLALYQLSEVPDTGLVNLLARDIQVYDIFKFMSSPSQAQKYGFQPQHYNLPEIFGADNYAVLSGSKIEISENGISSNSGAVYTMNANASLEYGPASWNPAPACNISTRNAPISAITIHTIQGSYSGAISWSQMCESNVSYHYVLKSSDGQVTQMVMEADKAWHVGSENNYTIGYEHEGYVGDSSWYTDEMYNSSADLSRDIINSGYGISGLRTYYGQATDTVMLIGGCTKIKGHQHYPNQTHTDPGICWDWERYYKLINNNPTITPITSATGTLTDSGGSGGNYTDDEREFWLIQPTNTASITLNFSAFNLEYNYDFLFIYDGDNPDSPLIGKYTGSNTPGTVTSSGGSILLEFRSDCSTTAAGWIANYTSTPVDIYPPSTSITAGAVWQTDDFTVDYVDIDNETSIKNRFYLISEKEVNANAPHSNGDFGFANEAFEDNVLNWYPVTGTYSMSNGTYTFGDVNEQNSNTYILVDQDNSSEYLYEWDQTITSNSTNQRAGIHFFCDDPNQSNRGNSYFVYLRSNGDLVQIYSVTNNSFTLEADSSFNIDEGVTYNCRVHYNPSTGWIRVFINEQFVAEWQDQTPLTSGNSVSLRTGGCEAAFDNVRVYKSRGIQTLVTAGPGEEMSIESEGAVPTGYIYSLVTDSLDNWSPITEHSYLLDFTVPEIITLNDGPGNDIDTVETATLEANWLAQDIHSGIQEYEVAIGTLPNLDDVLGWTSNGIAETFSHVLSNPVYNEVYHISLRVINGADLSEVYISNGQRFIDDLGLSDEAFAEVLIYPNPATDVIHIEGLETEATLYFYDANGKLCATHEITEGNTVNIPSLSTGMYRVVIRSGTRFVVRNLQVIK